MGTVSSHHSTAERRGFSTVDVIGGCMKVRQSARVQVQCPCSFSGEDVAGEGVVINLSRPGCAVETATPLRIGSRIELHLLLPIHFFPVAVDHAEVVWSTATRFGVKFVRVRPEDEARLQRLIEQSLRHDSGPSLAPAFLLKPSKGRLRQQPPPWGLVLWP